MFTCGTPAYASCPHEVHVEKCSSITALSFFAVNIFVTLMRTITHTKNKSIWKYLILLILGLITHFSFAQADYYWIGGSGDWTDLNHWAKSSGGSELYDVLPTGEDNVYFDANSFAEEGSIVYMDQDAIEVHHMDWRGSNNPHFIPADGVSFNSLRVNGSLYFHDGMTVSLRSLSLRPEDGVNETFKTGGINLGNLTISFFCHQGGISVQDSVVATKLSFVNMFYDLDFNENPIHTTNTIEFRLPIYKKVDLGGCDIYTKSFSMRAAVGSEGEMVTDGATLNIIYPNGNTQIEKSKYEFALFENYVIAEDHSILNYNPIFNTISIKEGVTLSIDHNIDSVELSNIITDATVENRVTIKSTSEGDQATIYAGSGTVEVQNVDIQDINAIGEATFNARASNDLGNVTGWNFIKENQTITFEGLDQKDYEDIEEVIDLGGTASSGLEVSYVSNNTDVAIINASNQLVVKGIGITEITASQGGDNLFYEADPIIRTFEVTKANQTIQFGEIEDRWVGDATLELTASSSSNLEVEFDVDGPATLNGTTVTITGVGTVQVTATQDGNENYFEASSVIQSFDTFKNEQTIEFEALEDQWVGDEIVNLTASSTSDLEVDYEVTGPATIDESTLSITGTGTIEVTAIQSGDAKYQEAIPITRSFEAFKLDQTITFNELTDIWVGEESISLDASTDAELEIDYTVSGPATLNGSTLEITGPGEIIVTALQSGDNYYLAASEVTHSFEAFKVEQTITFPSLEDVLLDVSTVTLNATSSSGLPIDYSIEGSGTLNGNVITLTNEGTITVTASQAGDHRYFSATSSARSFEVTIALGINKELNGTSVYPNPFVDYLKIDGSQEMTFKIMDEMGRVFKTGKTQLRTIELGELPNGRYLIALLGKEGISYHHIVKR